MSRTYFDGVIDEKWHRALRTLPGWWFKSGGPLIRVRRVGCRFVASVYDDEPQGFMRDDYTPRPGHTIIGFYRTVAAARDAAVVYIGHRDEPKLCKVSEIEKVRRENAAREREKAKATA
jgi:hypothetical protein